MSGGHERTIAFLKIYRNTTPSVLSVQHTMFTNFRCATFALVAPHARSTTPCATNVVARALPAGAHRPNKIEISVRGGAIRPIFSLRAGLACPVDVPLRARVPVAPRAPPPRRADARGSPPAAPIRARSRKPGNVRRGAQPTATGTSARDPNVARAGHPGQCRAMRRKGTRGARSPEMVLGGGRPI